MELLQQCVLMRPKVDRLIRDWPDELPQYLTHPHSSTYMVFGPLLCTLVHLKCWSLLTADQSFRNLGSKRGSSQNFPARAGLGRAEPYGIVKPSLNELDDTIF